MPPASQCPRCGHRQRGAFCQACGEDLHPEPVGLRSLTSYLWNRLSGVDGGVVHTWRRLAVAPGRTIDDYLSGARSRYAHPLDFILLLTGVLIVMTLAAERNHLVAVDLPVLGAGPVELPTSADDSLGAFLNLVVIAQCATAAALTRLWRWRASFNYTEHLYANAYLVGAAYSLQVLANLLVFVLRDTLLGRLLSAAVPVAIFICYTYGLADWVYGTSKWRRVVPAVVAGVGIYFLSFAAAVVLVLASFDILRHLA